jgi:hypothetical protein
MYSLLLQVTTPVPYWALIVPVPEVALKLFVMPPPIVPAIGTMLVTHRLYVPTLAAVDPAET